MPDFKFLSSRCASIIAHDKGLGIRVSSCGEDEVVTVFLPIYGVVCVSVDFYSGESFGTRLRILNLVGRIPDNKISRFKDLCNEFNRRNPCVTALLNSFNEVCITYDFPVNNDRIVSQVIEELLDITASALRECLPEFYDALKEDDLKTKAQQNQRNVSDEFDEDEDMYDDDEEEAYEDECDDEEDAECDDEEDDDTAEEDSRDKNIASDFEKALEEYYKSILGNQVQNSDYVVVDDDLLRIEDELKDDFADDPTDEGKGDGD